MFKGLLKGEGKKDKNMKNKKVITIYLSIISLNVNGLNAVIKIQGG